jgi:tripartite-type tricarboxylate transporter receptor subunit TctC
MPLYFAAISFRRAYRPALSATLILAAFALSTADSSAQLAGGRTITFIVPYTPGTGPDILARTISEEIHQRWHQPVIIDNKPGASGNLGTLAAANAKPDGYSVVIVSNPFTANVSLFKSVRYYPLKSFAPIAALGTGALALAVHPSVPAKTAGEFIDYVKAKPGQINYGSPGVGTPHHLAMEFFMLITKTDMVHVPYRGSAGATQDLLGGHVAAGFQAVHVALPLAQGNQIRLIGAAGKERVKAVPDLPTLAEQGVTGFDVALWYGALLPAGTPQDIVDKYNAVINEILREPRVIEGLAKQGLIAGGGSPQEFAEFLATDLVTWQKVVKEAGIAAE